jgi:hypothetical protein
MDLDWFSEDQTVFDQFADVVSRVRHGNFIDFIWVEPDFVFTAV